MKTYSISELAAEFDLTTRSIRFYEEKGLLHPERRGQTRIFSAADRTKLRLILRGKRLGLSLDESLDIIHMYDPERDNSPQLHSLINKIREKREMLQRQLNDIHTLLADLDDAEARCTEALTQIHGNSTTTSSTED